MQWFWFAMKFFTASSEFSARSSSDAALPLSLAPIAVDIRGQILTLHVEKEHEQNFKGYSENKISKK
jgi:hypothetical protein